MARVRKPGQDDPRDTPRPPKPTYTSRPGESTAPIWQNNAGNPYPGSIVGAGTTGAQAGPAVNAPVQQIDWAAVQEYVDAQRRATEERARAMQAAAWENYQRNEKIRREAANRRASMWNARAYTQGLEYRRRSEHDSRGNVASNTYTNSLRRRSAAGKREMVARIDAYEDYWNRVEADPRDAIPMGRPAPKRPQYSMRTYEELDEYVQDQGREARASLQNLTTGRDAETIRSLMGDEYIATIDQILANSDRLRGDDLARLYNDLIAEVNARVNQFNNSAATRGGIGGRMQRGALRALSSDPVQTALNIIEKPWEEIVANPIYAAQLGEREGSGLDGLTSGLAALVPFWDGKYEDDVNTREKRDELTRQGRLESFGQRVFGDAGPDLHLMDGAIHISASSLGDVAFNVMDPLDVLGAGVVRHLGRVGYRAGRAGIRRAARAEAGTLGERIMATANPHSFLFSRGGQDALVRAARAERTRWLESATGRSLRDAAEEMARESVERNLTDVDISRGLNVGRSQVTESVVSDILRETTLEGRAQVILNAFTEGTYQPVITARRQLAARAGIRSAVGEAGVPILFGHRAIKASRPMRNLLEKAARGTLNYAFIQRTRNTAVVISEGARRAAQHTRHKIEGDYWEQVVRPNLPRPRQANTNWSRAEGFQRRYERLAQQVDEWSSPLPFDDETEAATRAFAEDLLTEEFKRLDGIVRTTDPDSLDLTERQLQSLETFISLLRGEGGLRAREAALMQLRAGWTRRETNLTNTLRRARMNTGHRRVNLKATEVDLDGMTERAFAEARKVHADLKGAHINPALKRMRTDIEQALRSRIVELNRHIRDIIRNTPGKLTPDQEAQVRALMESLADAKARLAGVGLEVADARWRLYDSNITAMLKQSGIADAERARILDEALGDRLDAMADAALKNFGRLDVGGTLPVTRENLASVRMRMANLPQVVRDEIDAQLADGLAEGGGLVDLVPLAREIETLYAYPDILEETVRLLNNRNLRMRIEVGDATRSSRPGEFVQEAMQYQKAGIGRGPAGLNPVRGAAKIALSISESRAPSAIRFESSPNVGQTIKNRTEDMDRYLQALHFNAAARGEMTRRMRNPHLTELDIKEDIEMVYAAFAVREGVDPDEFVAAIRRRWAEDQRVFGIASDDVKLRRGFLGRKEGRIKGDVEMEQDIQVVAQRAEGIPVLEPAEMYRMMRDLKTAGGLNLMANPGQALRAGISQVVDRPLLGLQRRGQDISARYLAKKGHSFWKVAVVTNLHTAAVGFIGGYVTEDGTPAERLASGLRWGAIGLAGSVRYIGRVVGIEEGFRKVMDPAFTPRMLVPYYSRWRATRDAFLPFRLNNEVGAWNHPLEVWENSWLRSVSDDWVVVARGDTRFIDAWWRIANYQIHPDTDPVTRFLLQAKAERITLDEAHKLIDEFLETHEGAAFLRRIRATKGHQGGGRGAIIDRYQKFLDYHLPTPQLARMRLEAAEAGTLLDRDVFKAARKEGHAPKALHAQESWRMPKNAKQLLYTSRTAYRAVLETPTALANRIPFARKVYADDFNRLVDSGMDPKLAQEVAEQSAVDTTNRLFFRQDDQSRFAENVDIFFPFQQPREEMIRVYAQMFANNKARVMHLTRLGAVAFNNGEERGVFVKDPYTGNWRMRVPGSMWLSNVLGLGGTTFEVNLVDLTFLFRGMQGSPAEWGEWENLEDFGFGIMPTPGGPYWSVVSRLAFNRFPEFHDRVHGTWAYDRLFPYGANGQLFTPFSRRMWMAMTGSTPPWEFASQVEMENELRRYQQEVYLQLIWEHLQENPGDTEWTPSLEDVRQGTQDFLTVWTLLSAVSPGTVKAQLNYEREFEDLKQNFVNSRGEFQYGRFLQARPELAPFVEPTGEWVGPETYQWWEREHEEGFKQWALHNRRRLSLEAFDANIREGRRIQRMWSDYRQALSVPYNGDRARALRAFYDKYGEEWNFHDRYWQMEQVADILRSYPRSQQEEHLNNFRLEMRSRGIEISYRSMQRMLRDVRGGVLREDPWRNSMSNEEVMAWVDSQRRRGVSLSSILEDLKPVEQVKYFQERRLSMYFDADFDDPERWMDEYQALGRRIAAIYDENPQLAREGYERGPYADPINVQRWRRETRAEVSRMYEEIANLSAARQRAYEAQRWDEFNMLRDQVRQARNNLREYQNELYRNGPPGMVEMQGEMRGLIHMQPSSGRARFLRNMFERQGVPYYDANEELDYFNRTDDAQEAYIADLAAALSKPLEDDGYTEGKLFWEWMTDFQRDLLRRNFPQDIIEDWMGTSPESSRSGGGGRGWRNFRRWGARWRRPVNNPNDGSNALYYAYDLMRFYSKRAPGAKAPAAYQEYLALPQDPAIRADFLRRHPEVRDWISQGPLANMPEIYRYIVIDIMVRNGKWEGEPRDISAITEIAWAREQLNRWNMRGNQLPPETYNIWVNMPTGVAKAEYLAANPEIAEWLRLGPMRNMPEAYQEVVRDIMIRYGEWTQAQDPLGMVLSEFYKQPSYAKDAFLEKHPELVAYFAAMRTPEEQRLFELAEGYYALPDANARRMYLAAHPELNDYFVGQRTKRYERFMNQVAIYMGQNPELFEQYLTRQNDVLSELVRRFGEPSLVRELRAATTSSQAKSSASRGTSGRRRQA